MMLYSRILQQCFRVYNLYFSFRHHLKVALMLFADHYLSGGDVLSWGLNSHGQLGLGKEVSLQYFPLLVCSLTGVAVSHIAAGGTHSLFLTLPGLVYCCGANKDGQLGLNRVDEKGNMMFISFSLHRIAASQLTTGIPASSAGPNKYLTKIQYRLVFF
uniref:Uncharacterized protein n=1 Tax=Gouania willdenowi TaxID=441366 RepID=A0A8C5NAT9_GOUWI